MRAIITGNGVYNHPANDWSDGSLRFEMAGNRIGVAQIKHVQDYRQGLGGDVDLKANGTAKVVKNAVSLTSLNGQLNLRNAVLDGRPYGNIQLTASTRLPVLSIDARVNFGGIQLERQRRVAHGRRLSRAGAFPNSACHVCRAA